MPNVSEEEVSVYLVRSIHSL